MIMKSKKFVNPCKPIRLYRVWISLVFYSFNIENDLGDKGAKCIARLLETNETLTSLDISGIFLIYLR